MRSSSQEVTGRRRQVSQHSHDIRVQRKINASHAFVPAMRETRAHANLEENKCDGARARRTCAEREARLLAHVAEAHRDGVAAGRLQAAQQELHRVVAARQLVVSLLFADHVAHVDGVRLPGGGGGGGETDAMRFG